MGWLPPRAPPYSWIKYGAGGVGQDEDGSVLVPADAAAVAASSAASAT